VSRIFLLIFTCHDMRASVRAFSRDESVSRRVRGDGGGGLNVVKVLP
jgi:hypothetical protein